MSVEFEEGDTELAYNPPQQLPGTTSGPLERLLIRLGVAGDAQRADYFLIGIMFIFMIATYFIFYGFVWSGGREVHTVTQEQRDELARQAAAQMNSPAK
jgi:hypothetical protein